MNTKNNANDERRIVLEQLYSAKNNLINCFVSEPLAVRALAEILPAPRAEVLADTKKYSMNDFSKVVNNYLDDGAHKNGEASTDLANYIREHPIKCMPLISKACDPCRQTNNISSNLAGAYSLYNLLKVFFLKKNEGLAYDLAKKFMRQTIGCEFVDIHNLTRMAIITACDGFDPSLKNAFGTYLWWYVRSAIQREGFWRTGDPKKKILMSIICDDGFDRGVLLKDSKSPNPFESAFKAELSERINKLLDELGRDRRGRVLGDILRRYYGLNGNDCYTIREISEELGVSRQRTQQIIANTYRRLRRILDKKSIGLEDFVA